MPPISSDIVAEGELSTTLSTVLFSPGSGEQLVDGSITFYHTGSVDRTVTTSIKKAGGTARVVDVTVLGPTYDQWSFSLSKLKLGPLDEFQAGQDAGTDVTFVLMGGSNA